MIKKILLGLLLTATIIIGLVIKPPMYILADEVEIDYIDKYFNTNLRIENMIKDNLIIGDYNNNNDYFVSDLINGRIENTHFQGKNIIDNVNDYNATSANELHYFYTNKLQVIEGEEYTFSISLESPIPSGLYFDYYDEYGTWLSTDFAYGVTSKSSTVPTGATQLRLQIYNSGTVIKPTIAQLEIGLTATTLEVYQPSVVVMDLSKLFGNEIPTIENLNSFVNDTGYFEIISNHIWDSSVPEVIINSTTIDYNATTFQWERSVFARSGSNVKDINVDFMCENESNSSNTDPYFFYEFDGYTKEIHLDCEDYFYRNYIPLDADDQAYLKRILFDRDNSPTRKMGYRVVLTAPSLNYTDDGEPNGQTTTAFTLGIGLEFYTNQEFQIANVVVSGGEFRNNAYGGTGSQENLYLFDYNLKPFVMLYDTDEQYATNETKLFTLPTKYQEVYGLRYETLMRFVDYDNEVDYTMEYTEFNAFTTSTFFKPPVSTNDFIDESLLIPTPEYQSCGNLDIFCQVKNGVTWVFVDFPPIAILYQGFSLLLNFMYSLLTITLSLVGITIVSGTMSSSFTGIIAYILGIVGIIIVWKFLQKVGGLF